MPGCYPVNIMSPSQCDNPKCLYMLAQLCPTLSNSIDWGLPDSSVHGILQARILEWVAIFFFPKDLPDPGIKPRSPTLKGLDKGN